MAFLNHRLKQYALLQRALGPEASS